MILQSGLSITSRKFVDIGKENYGIRFQIFCDHDTLFVAYAWSTVEIAPQRVFTFHTVVTVATVQRFWFAFIFTEPHVHHSSVTLILPVFHSNDGDLVRAYATFFMIDTRSLISESSDFISD